jgi:hypothetical protein
VGVEHCGADGGGIGFDVTDVDGVSLPASLLQDVFQFGVRGVGTQEARHVFTWQPGEDGAAGEPSPPFPFPTWTAPSPNCATP